VKERDQERSNKKDLGPAECKLPYAGIVADERLVLLE
jgi:hypothetical protein